MSWSTFKSNILRRADSPENIKDIDFVANLWATEYDRAIKAGGDIVNRISVQNGNVGVMETLLKSALFQGQSTNLSSFSLVTQFGQAVTSYWTGATMNVFPIPLLPAPGSVQNIAVNSNLVVNPGVWTPTPPISPTTSTALIVDQFIQAGTIHLTTVSGIIQTTSLYPSVPTPIPSPGVIPWVGYNVLPAVASIPNIPGLSGAIDKIDNSSTALSPEQIESAKIEKQFADMDTINDDSGGANEYSSLKSFEIEEEETTAAPIELTEEEFDAVTDYSDAQCTIGSVVIKNARKDIGILETGSPPGLNYGGFAGGTQLQKPGRIDAMMKNTGLNNQSKVSSDGSGYYWCAGAVTTWWKEAGLPTPKGAAACRNWATWAKTNGYFSANPVVGAAILYGSPAHHIGVVASILPNGSLVTIEGNTSGGGFNRNGVGCFEKTIKDWQGKIKSPNKSILGFVIPPDCIVP